MVFDTLLDVVYLRGFCTMRVAYYGVWDLGGQLVYVARTFKGSSIPFRKLVEWFCC